MNKYDRGFCALRYKVPSTELNLESYNQDNQPL